MNRFLNYVRLPASARSAAFKGSAGRNRSVPAKPIRKGAISIEMMFVIPIVLVFFFGMWEWSRVEMVKHVCQNACFEGARLGTLPGYTEGDCEQRVRDILKMYFVNGGTATADIDEVAGTATVSVMIPVDENFSVGFSFFNGRAIKSTMTLVL